MENIKNLEDFLGEGSKKWIAGAIANRGALKASLGMDKDEILKNARINKELARLKKEDKDPKKPGAQLDPKDAKMFKRLNLAKTLSKLKECDDAKNYMFFQNIKNVCMMCQEILEMDTNQIDEMLGEHPWAVDHVATSKDDIEEVYGFLKTNVSWNGEEDEEGEDTKKEIYLTGTENLE